MDAKPTAIGSEGSPAAGTLAGSLTRFKSVREGAETEPGGEMVLVGPIRD